MKGLTAATTFRVVYNVMTFTVLNQLWLHPHSWIASAAGWSAGVVIVYILFGDKRPASTSRT